MSLVLLSLRESRLHCLRRLSCRSIRIRLLWHYTYSQGAVHLMCFGRSLHLPTRLGFCLPPVWPAVHCECMEGSRLLAVIGLCRSLWRPLAAAAEGAASESVCLRRGGHPAERAGSGLWVGTPDQVDLSSPRWAPPYSSRPRQLSQRGLTASSETRIQCECVEYCDIHIIQHFFHV